MNKEARWYNSCYQVNSIGFSLTMIKNNWHFFPSQQNPPLEAFLKFRWFFFSIFCWWLKKVFFFVSHSCPFISFEWKRIRATDLCQKCFPLAFLWSSHCCWTWSYLKFKNSRRLCGGVVQAETFVSLPDHGFEPVASVKCWMLKTTYRMFWIRVWISIKFIISLYVGKIL